MAKRNSFSHQILELVEVMLISFSVFGLVYIFLGQLLEVDGTSMLPTFQNKERIIAEKISIKYKPLIRGDIVIFQHPTITQKHLLIKRVVGLPGEIITIKEGNVYINEVRLRESYLGSDTISEQIIGGVLKEGADYKIDANSYFLMGDNREHSTDSRYFGSVNMDKIIGRALLVYYPITSFRLVEQY